MLKRKGRKGPPFLHPPRALSLHIKSRLLPPRETSLLSLPSLTSSKPQRPRSYKYTLHGYNPSLHPSPTTYMLSLPYLSPLEVCSLFLFLSFLPASLLRFVSQFGRELGFKGGRLWHPPSPSWLERSAIILCFAKNHGKSTEESVKLRRDSALDDDKGTVKMKFKRFRSSDALSILSFMASSYSQEYSISRSI